MVIFSYDLKSHFSVANFDVFNIYQVTFVLLISG